MNKKVYIKPVTIQIVVKTPSIMAVSNTGLRMISTDDADDSESLSRDMERNCSVWDE